MESSHPSSGRSATPADINRNGRPASIGTGGPTSIGMPGRHRRNTHLTEVRGPNAPRNHRSLSTIFAIASYFPLTGKHRRDREPEFSTGFLSFATRHRPVGFLTICDYMCVRAMILLPLEGSSMRRVTSLLSGAALLLLAVAAHSQSLPRTYTARSCHRRDLRRSSNRLNSQQIQLVNIAPVIFSLIIFVSAIAPVQAQQEFPPPQGKGRVVVVVSGHEGAAAYRGFAAQIAQLGYDAVLFDANNIAGNESAALRTAIQQAQQMPHAIPGKVGLVGLSQGGGQVLIYGSQMSDVASVVVAWYPATRSIHSVSNFVTSLRLPVLVLAGEADTGTQGCCPIGDRARTRRRRRRRQFELVAYPNTQSRFIYGSRLQSLGLRRRDAMHRRQVGPVCRPLARPGGAGHSPATPCASTTYCVIHTGGQSRISAYSGKLAERDFLEVGEVEIDVAALHLLGSAPTFGVDLHQHIEQDVSLASKLGLIPSQSR